MGLYLEADIWFQSPSQKSDGMRKVFVCREFHLKKQRLVVKVQFHEGSRFISL